MSAFPDLSAVLGPPTGQVAAVQQPTGQPMLAPMPGAPLMVGQQAPPPPAPPSKLPMLLLLGLAGYGIYYYVDKKKDELRANLAAATGAPEE